MLAGSATCSGADRDAGESAIEEYTLAEAVTVIGTDDARPGHALFRVRGALRLAGGKLAVADGSTGEVRIFDGAGTLERVLGGQGGGPGEHRGLTAIWSSADTVISYDGPARKVVFWSVDDEGMREEWMRDPAQHLVGRLDNGTFLGLAIKEPVVFPKGSSQVDTAVFSLVQTEGRGGVELARLPYQVRYAATLPDGRTIYTPLPLEPKSVYGTGDGSVYVGHGAEGALRRYDESGERLRDVETSFTRGRLTDALQKTWQDSITALMPAAEQPAMAEYLEALPYNTELPTFDAIIVGDDGNVWVRQFSLPGSAEVRWAVLQPHGNVLAQLTLPVSDRLYSAGDDHVVVGSSREDGAETVTLWRLGRR